MRLIDAYTTSKTYLVDTFDTLDDFERVNDILEYAPTVDAVPVVRCKDCINYEPDKYFDGCVFPAGLNCPEPDDFCSHGERKD